MKKKFKQRLIFSISEVENGQMRIAMEFYPPIANSKELFDKLPLHRQEIHNKAVEIARAVMQQMAKGRTDATVLPIVRNEVQDNDRGGEAQTQLPGTVPEKEGEK